MRKFLMVAAMLVSTSAWAAYPTTEQSEAVNTNRTTGNVFAGLGFGGFTSTLGNLSTVGVAWQVRAGMNAWHYFGAELNYQGESSAANTIVQGGTVLAGTNFTEQQITADVILGYPVQAGDHIIRPYALAGAGYGHIGIDTSLNAIGLPSENAGAFPFGVGMSFNMTRDFVLDARYTYNVLTETAGNSWNVAFNLGALF